MLLPEIDEKATIRGCKRKLREYPRWREIAHDSAEQKITQELYRPDYRRILIEKYLAYPPKPNWQIAQAIGFERTAFQELLNNAILAFAELYRNGQLVVER